MDYWGVKSYENDGAADALDAGFDRAHGSRYEELMDDRNPLTFEQVQQRLADLQTLQASIDAPGDSLDPSNTLDSWDDWTRLALVGIVCAMPSWACRFLNHGDSGPSTGWSTRRSSGMKRQHRGCRLGKKSLCSSTGRLRPNRGDLTTSPFSTYLF